MKTKVTISVKLEYDGNKYNKKAVLSGLSSGTYIINEKVNNDCIEVYEEEILDRGLWSVHIELDDNYILEVFFKYNHESYELTFDYSHSLIWNSDGVILDEVEPIIKVR